MMGPGGLGRVPVVSIGLGSRANLVGGVLCRGGNDAVGGLLARGVEEMRSAGVVSGWVWVDTRVRPVARFGYRRRG